MFLVYLSWYLCVIHDKKGKQIMTNDYKQITIKLTDDEIEILSTIDSETATVEGAILTGVIGQILTQRESK